uniref:Uncharacterized protein n=1 Tax=Vespula pensylvanica TaxID=30213 RepID=A0A834JNV7_VESPE|nr:hypothetical protein H0235_017714 [Vespula pensylvanica]
MPADQRATTTLVDAYQPRANDGANFRDAGLLPPSPYPHYPPQPPPSSSPSTTASTDIVATLFTLCPTFDMESSQHARTVGLLEED